MSPGREREHGHHRHHREHRHDGHRERREGGRRERRRSARADEPEMEPKYCWGPGEEHATTASALCASTPDVLKEMLAAMGASPPEGTDVFFCDAHNVLEIGGETNPEVVKLLGKLLDARVHVVVLSWVGFTPLAKVRQEIIDMLCSASGLGERGTTVPVVTCTGNRIAKMLLVELTARHMAGGISRLLDDSDRNLRSSFSQANLALARSSWGFESELRGEYLMYVKRRAQPEASAMARFVASTCQRFANVRDDQEDPMAAAFGARAFVAMDRERLLSHAAPSLSVPALALKHIVQWTGKYATPVV